MSNCFETEYYSCPGWPSYPTPVSGTSDVTLRQPLEHIYEIDLGFDVLYGIKSYRAFEITGTLSWTKSVHAVIETTCEGGSVPPCLSWCASTDTTARSNAHETCRIAKDTIYYLDFRTNTVFYKHEEEELIFNASSNESTVFRAKWGNSTHHKIKIKNAKIVGKEQFILVFNGVKRVLNEIVYEKEPTWMMGPIGIPTTDGVVWPTGCEAYDHDIQQILVWPLPMSKAIPLDNEVKCLGFYDYGYEQPGVIPEIVTKDGGKDFFYPSWVRESMIADPFWAEVRTARYGIRWEHQDPAGLTSYSRPEITHDPVPKGNAVVSTVFGNMFSFAFQDRDGIAHGVAELNGVDPRQAIVNLGVTGYGEGWLYHPISVL